MINIDNIVAKIPHMSAKERKIIRQNVEFKLGKDPSSASAQKVKAALDAAEPKRSDTRSRTGHLEWDPHDSEMTSFYGYLQESTVARIFKRANHRNQDKDVYTLELFGKEIGIYAHIRQAREAGEEAFIKGNKIDV